MKDLNGNADAMEWADQFYEVQKSLGQEPLDRDWMLGWFANAIMAGYDFAQRQSSDRT